MDPTEFGPIAKSTLADRITTRIAQMIREGDYGPGDRLPTINDMASRFGVGHPTLREALKKLETLGLVNVKHGSGVYVEAEQDQLLMSNPIFAGEVSKDMMLDLIDARMPIEQRTVVLAARHATEEHLERMHDLLEEAGEYLQDDAELTRKNMAFHREVAVASQNVVLAQLLKVLSNLFEEEQRGILDVYGSRKRDHSEHMSILEAIRLEDEDLAKTRMREHLEGVREMIQQWDPEQTPLS